MAKKKAAGAWLTDFERLVGGIFFLLYLVVFPLTAKYLFRGIETLMGLNLSDTAEHAIYYYFVFALTILIFYNFIGKTTHRFFSSLGHTLATVGMGLVAFYGLNELVYRLTYTLLNNHTNLNDSSISAQMVSAPRTTFLIVVFLAPFVEEVLFRGYIFGMLRDHSRWIAYVVSCVLFALLHVWQFALGTQNLYYLVLMLQYLVPGLVLAWTYERSGNLWGPLLVHMGVNALSMWLR